MKKCPNCGFEIPDKGCAKGGRKSRRKLSKREARAMADKRWGKKKR